MVGIFFQGVVLGLIIAITLGPAFFSIIQTGINRGFRSGLFMAIGISISDLVLITISYFGIAHIFANPNNKLYIGIIGGIVLIGFGLVTFSRKPEVLKRRSANYVTPTKIPGPFAYIVKGFLLNIANPFIILFWLAAMGWVSSHAEKGELLNYAFTFFLGTIATVFATDLLKSYVGNKIKPYLRPRIQLWINKIVGMLLMIFAVILIVRVLMGW